MKCNKHHFLEDLTLFIGYGTTVFIGLILLLYFIAININ